MNLVNLLAQTAPEIIGAITRSPAKIVEESTYPSADGEQPSLSAVAGLEGDVSGVLSVRCSEETAQRLFDRIVHTNAPRNEDSVRDLMAEILNLLIAQIKAGLTYQGKALRYSVPSVVRDDEETAEGGLLFVDEPPLLLKTDVGHIEIRFVPVEGGEE